MSSGYLRAPCRARRGIDREFFPLAGRSEAIEVEQGSAVHDGATDLDYAAEANQVLVVDLIPVQQLGVIAEITQEPVKLPQCFWGAVEASHEGVAGQRFRGKHGELKRVVGLLCVPKS